MKLKVKPIDFEAGGKGVVILNKEDIANMGIHALDRVLITKGKKSMIVIVDVAEKFAKPGEVVTNADINTFFRFGPGETADVRPVPAPESLLFIKEKIRGGRLTAPKMLAIVKDVVERHLSETELSAFVTALDVHGMSMDEVEHLTRAMLNTGKTIKLPNKIICDKHSIGGIPGNNKSSMLVVPIVAAAGLTIPKTSSRAITSPAGTADCMEVLCPVALSAEEIVRAVRKTNACLVWGGALELAPADDAFIKVEYPLGIDPLLLPSIMAKKAALGSRYVVIDIPTGRGAKIKTVGEAHNLAEDFIELGQRLGMTVVCGITYGEQPLGWSMGPALEAQEALAALAGKASPDVIEKSTQLAGLLFDMVGKNKMPGKRLALQILKSGKAEKKMREIIAAQGGDPKIKPDDIPIGDKTVHIKADTDGEVFWIKNAEIAAIAREAGAPKDAGAGVRLGVKVGDPVKKGQILFTIYSSTNSNLNAALKLAEEFKPIVAGKHVSERMLLDMVPTKIPHRKIFMLER
ncbi:MAG: AMP phosphorylase [Candidatus Aenigmatarchaeota archaeon]